mmetsp:Transcript_2637/g.7928  ORF Transcript_2637/g.7928 Transcript_2637/m.7928 type:complete len:235 (+) Transcript_2637:1296-2000(+)
MQFRKSGRDDELLFRKLREPAAAPAVRPRVRLPGVRNSVFARLGAGGGRRRATGARRRPLLDDCGQRARVPQLRRRRHLPVRAGARRRPLSAVFSALLGRNALRRRRIRFFCLKRRRRRPRHDDRPGPQGRRRSVSSQNARGPRRRRRRRTHSKNGASGVARPVRQEARRQRDDLGPLADVVAFVDDATEASRRRRRAQTAPRKEQRQVDVDVAIRETAGNFRAPTDDGGRADL